MTHEFTSDWFTYAESTWIQIISELKPEKILEIGCFEGRSACWMIETLPKYLNSEMELVCVDQWHQGKKSEEPSKMELAEKRFDRNIQISLDKNKNSVRFRKIKAASFVGLATLIMEGLSGTFDLIYVDGDHSAAGTLSDAVMAFRLLRVGGIMVFDDYLWANDRNRPDDVLRTPKIAIDAFLNIHWDKIRVMHNKPIYQIYAKRIC
jgi:predicted O-methyltransferase YrrM